MTSIGLLLGLILFLVVQYLVGLAAGQALTGNDAQEFAESIEQATGESGVWQDVIMPIIQGLCLAIGPALLQAPVVRRFDPNARPVYWIVGMSIGGAIGGIALASVKEMLGNGMVQFDLALTWEFVKLALILAVAPSIVGAVLLKSSGLGLRFLVANIVGWGLGVGVGVAFVIMVVQAQLFGEQIDLALTYVVAVGTLVAGLVLGMATGLALRSSSQTFTG